MLVAVQAMSTDFLNRSALMNAAVTIHYIVITYAVETSLPVASINLCNAEISPFGGSGAVNDNFINTSHKIIV